MEERICAVNTKNIICKIVIIKRDDCDYLNRFTSFKNTDLLLLLPIYYFY